MMRNRKFKVRFDLKFEIFSLNLLTRFWQCLDAYKNKETYCEIMIKFFSGLSTGKYVSHTKIKNSQLN